MAARIPFLCPLLASLPHRDILFSFFPLCFNDFHFTNHPSFFQSSRLVQVFSNPLHQWNFTGLRGWIFSTENYRNSISFARDCIRCGLKCLFRPNSSHLFFHDHLHLLPLPTVNYDSTISILSSHRESRETFDSGC